MPSFSKDSYTFLHVSANRRREEAAEAPPVLNSIRVSRIGSDFLKNGDACLGSLGETRCFTGFFKTS